MFKFRISSTIVVKFKLSKKKKKSLPFRKGIFNTKHTYFNSYITYWIVVLTLFINWCLLFCIFVIAPSVENVQGAVERIFPLVYEFKTIKPAYRNNDKLDSSVFMSRNPCPKPPVVEEDSDLSDEDSVNQMDSDASCG